MESEGIVKNKGDLKIVKDKSYNQGFLKKGLDVYTFEFNSGHHYAQPTLLPFYDESRAVQPVRVGEFDIIPFGANNQYPEEIRREFEDNNLAPQNISKKVSLLWGQGPELYFVKFENGKRIKYFDRDPDIEAWLKTWDYIRYLEMVSNEVRVGQGYFSTFYRNKGARIGNKAFIAKLKCVPNYRSRLEWYDQAFNINNIITGDFERPWINGLTKYPVWDKYNPFQYPVSMRYTNLYSFGRDLDYALCSFHGTRSWMKLDSSIPKLLYNYNENGASLRYHIQSPPAFWRKREAILIKNCLELNKNYVDSMLDDLKDKYMEKFAEVLANVRNVGKFIHTEITWDDEAMQLGEWKIEPIDGKVKDYIEAQISIVKRADQETSAGLNLPSALSNFSADGNLSSGSEQLYAFKLYLMTDTAIPEYIVLKDINEVIAANFPNKDMQLGFYHDNVLTEEQTNPADRVKNNSPTSNNKKA